MIKKPDHLKIVPDYDRLESRDAVRAEIENGNESQADLVRRSGYTRGQIRGMIKQYGSGQRLKDPERRTVNESTEPKAEESSTTWLSKLVHLIHGFGLFAVAMVVLACGVWLNYQYNSALGHDADSSKIMGALGVAVDAAPTVLMPWAVRLWRRGRYVSWGMALGVWLVCICLSAIANMSFSATNIGDHFGKVASLKWQSEQLTSLYNADRDELAGIKAQMEQGRFPYRMVTRRTELETEIRKLYPQIAAMPPIESKDPGADHISMVMFGYISPQRVENARVIGLALVLMTPGILLALI